MAAMSTVLKTFSDSRNTRTFSSAGHLAIKPSLVVQRRKVPTGNQVILEDSITVIQGVSDSDGVLLPQRASFEFKVRRPLAAVALDVALAEVIFRDIVSSDEFVALVNTQNFIAGN